MILDGLDLSLNDSSNAPVESVDSMSSPGTINKNGIGLNLDLLNEKIKAVRGKKMNQ